MSTLRSGGACLCAGIAPPIHFLSNRGFLQQRQQQVAAAAAGAAAAAAAGPCWLFFGCRRSEEDYLYRSEWDAFLRAGTLTRLEVAFSRAQVRAQDPDSQQGLGTLAGLKFGGAVQKAA